MKDQEIIIAVAKLDGRHINWDMDKQEFYILDDRTRVYCCAPASYLTSWDAIVPVIEKHWQECAESSQRTRFELCTPPRELCILLLKATGGWIDEEKVVDNPSSVA